MSALTTSTKAQFDVLRDRIIELHPHEMPAVAVGGGGDFAADLDWIAAQTEASWICNNRAAQSTC